MIRHLSGTANEVLLLESRLRQQRTETHPASSEDEYFLLSSIDTVLRARGLSYQQIEDGVVEGANDGGIDAVYTFYNGALVEDETEAGSADEPQIDLEIIQAKNERGFKEVALQRLIDHLPLLLQLDAGESLSAEFNERVLERFGIFRALLTRASGRFPNLTVRVHYVTKSVDPPHEKVTLKAQRLKERVKESFQISTPEVDFVDAAELNARARQRLSAVLELKVSEGPISADKGGLVCLVTLADYYKFITDDSFRLREEVFEENVRGYEGATVINRAIADSLRQGDDSAVDFWWLNNGVTILGKRVQPSGKRLVVEDPQIVNGLQTSRSVFQYFHALRLEEVRSAEGHSRQILVRVIESADEKISAQVIKATNSQNRISVATLRATEPFQRSIEQFLAQHHLYYERKKNQYKNQNKPRANIVEVLELAQALAAIILCEPHTARGRPSALVRDPLYGKLFNKSAPLAAYLTSIRIMQNIDHYLESSHPQMKRPERSNIRFHLARAATAFAISSSRPKMTALPRVDPDTFDATRLNPVFEWVTEAREVSRESTGYTDNTVLAKGPEWSKEMDRRLSRYSDKNRWPKKITGSWS
jgi:hypothetical protein